MDAGKLKAEAVSLLSERPEYLTAKEESIHKICATWGVTTEEAKTALVAARNSLMRVWLSDKRSAERDKERFLLSLFVELMLQGEELPALTYSSNLCKEYFGSIRRVEAVKIIVENAEALFSPDEEEKRRSWITAHLGELVIDPESAAMSYYKSTGTWVPVPLMEADLEALGDKVTLGRFYLKKGESTEEGALQETTKTPADTEMEERQGSNLDNPILQMIKESLDRYVEEVLDAKEQIKDLEEPKGLSELKGEINELSILHNQILSWLGGQNLIAVSMKGLNEKIDALKKDLDGEFSTVHNNMKNDLDEILGHLPFKSRAASHSQVGEVLGQLRRASHGGEGTEQILSAFKAELDQRIRTLGDDLQKDHLNLKTQGEKIATKLAAGEERLLHEIEASDTFLQLVKGGHAEVLITPTDDE